MLTCSKTYPDIPFAHRQHLHEGHCAFVHGHNWSITLTFACAQPDANGFVVDFGRLKYIRQWIDKNLDHACLFNADDPMREVLLEAAPTVWKATYITAPSIRVGSALVITQFPTEDSSFEIAPG